MSLKKEMGEVLSAQGKEMGEIKSNLAALSAQIAVMMEMVKKRERDHRKGRNEYLFRKIRRL